MTEQYAMMRQNIRMLGQFLGQVITSVHGEEIFELVEQIRQYSKSDNQSGATANEVMQALENIKEDEIIPLARAFSHFLNLVNLAEQHQATSRKNKDYINSSRSIDVTIAKLKAAKIAPAKIYATINELLIDLVLTAHPTEVARRSLVHKYAEINKCLRKLDYDCLTEQEIALIKQRLLQLIAQTWHTAEIREHKPTPIEEAKWGLAVVENSLWDAVPKFWRNLDNGVYRHFKKHLAAERMPIKISSWVGGDRDGNPNVTAEVTEQVIYYSRWKAAQLFHQDTQQLAMELSVVNCTDEFRQKYGNYREPYRVVVKLLRRKLFATMEYYKNKVFKLNNNVALADTIFSDNDLWEPLYDCYKSLVASNMAIIADGLLLDCLCRVKAFGVTLLKLDVRQDSSKHTAAMAEITKYIGLGDYAAWSERKKQEFLINELNSKRPLIPQDWQPSPETAEVLATFKLIAAQPPNIFNAYIISMAKAASDILLVKLLLAEYGMQYELPVVPLFETLEDLNAAPKIMQTLFKIDWYYKNIDNKVMIMIGYSDSAKDAGVMAAAWAQYRAQENLLAVCDKYKVKLRLFHGRGGTIGRGGAPAHEALLSQPPESLKHGLRVTEQGEMIRFKLGFREVAVETFSLYASAVLEANLLPPPKPRLKWRRVMNILATKSCAVYNDVVRKNDNFIDYFNAITPIAELGNLPLSSRPAKRFQSKGIEGLRAIPWIFAWTQNRLLLPTWLGAGESIQYAVKLGYKKDIEEMCRYWPFFAARISLLEMVCSKINLDIVKEYEKYLVAPPLQKLSKTVRRMATENITAVLSLNTSQKPLANLPWIADSIAQRNIYTAPLNLLQIVLLKKLRQEDLSEESKQKLQTALMIVITGIAAGMRNTG